ncbi:KilA-N domain-containing protein [Deinococcus sp. 12RED42]|uniref:KilA-N domain-containing protein n=1 Tax=Deinococcus sp. 12RED42 TaxID=2745872 RepID=UPI001E2BA61F|nr:KilA-N domain-containing protein [Deinococcus sp. 12RED42]MCD0165418.1 KilA-N domain-containing protein [Deinococcus sp. 12RED42]
MINATQLIKELNSRKLFGDWHQLASTKALLHRKSEETGLSAGQLIKVVKGGRPDQQGSWVHECLVEDLMRWCTPAPPPSFYRDETIFGDMLDATFAGISQFQRQYSAGKHKIDFYDVSHKLAVEFDERHHSRNRTADTERELALQELLGCTFIRVRQGSEYQGLNLIVRFLVSCRE